MAEYKVREVRLDDKCHIEVVIHDDEIVAGSAPVDVGVYGHSLYYKLYAHTLKRVKEWKPSLAVVGNLGEGSMIGKSEMGVIEARYKSYHSDMFKPRDADEWLAHGKQMETLWSGYDLPPATIPPALYVLSMQMQVAPSKLTAKRLKQALDEDLGGDVPLPVARNLLDEYAYFEEQAPYAQQIPKEIDIFKTTIAKHYLPTSAFHKGSIRTVKPKPDVLVTMGCLKRDKWDAKSVTCTPNPTVMSTVVPKTKEYLDEVDHLKLVHPKVKVNHREKEVGVEPRLSDEEQRELEAVDRAVEKTEVVDDG